MFACSDVDRIITFSRKSDKNARRKLHVYTAPKERKRVGINQAARLTSSLISLLQGPVSVSSQIRKVLPAGMLRMTLSAAAHAAVQEPAKASRKK